ncbi:hypothetical protein N7540_012237 [Penicillium herquei]|nr:hypothetical protein N7540_012237 [Penicillium herquei]
MAAADPPAGLMDIASSMSRDEIPMKLRCAICNTLAVNAFRLPCCDQSICESCQTSLPDTCPVCAHTPVSPDLCKPNKALRTTLKAYLRTEEKKREKERQAAAPPTPTVPTPVESVNTPTDPTTGPATIESVPQVAETDAPASQEPAGDLTTGNLPVQSESTEDANELESQQTTDMPHESSDDQDIQQVDSLDADAPVHEDSTNTDRAAPDASAPPTVQEGAEPGDSDVMNTNTSGFPSMGWNNTGSAGGVNGTNTFMPNGMFPFSNQMGIPGAMNPMAANQGMFGEYGMNMTGMGMNMGMNYNGQGMYGSLGWDNSQQNMWQGGQGQDKFNPNAFANGSGPPYGGAFGGSNMSYPNSGFQSGYYGSGYGHGGFRGRGRGYYNGASGRGGFGGHGQGHSAPFTNSGVPDRPPPSDTPLDDSNDIAGGDDSQAIKAGSTEPTTDANTNPADVNSNAEAPTTENDAQQLQGIPTIDSLDESMVGGRGDYGGHMGMAYRRGYMREPPFWGNTGIQPHLEATNPGVEGAPAAPRAMREGLPNTSVLRQRGFYQGNPSAGNNMPVTAQSGRDRGKDRKRSRRDRSESANGSEYSTNPRTRRVKTHHDDPPRTNGAPPAAAEEKDPHTLEREARNRERLLREKERREKAKSGQRRGSRQERMVAGRLISCKYEDEL